MKTEDISEFQEAEHYETPEYRQLPADLQLGYPGLPITWNPVEHCCQRCKGWCCAGFTCNTRLLTDKLDKAWRRRHSLEEIRCVKFMKKNFYRLYPKLRYSNECACRQYDAVNGRCKVHWRRPAICRQFICGYAWKHRTWPTAANFKWQADILQNLGVNTNQIQRRT